MFFIIQKFKDSGRACIIFFGQITRIILWVNVTLLPDNDSAVTQDLLRDLRLRHYDHHPVRFCCLLPC
jgi:hypothetical protein